MGKSPKQKGGSESSTPLEADWIAAARDMLIEGGIAAVEINPLANRLGVTRGGFYWRFKNRQDLLDHLLADWHNTNTVAFLNAVGPSGTPKERYFRLVRLWLDEQDFLPELDTAVRQWGRIDPEVGRKVEEADEIRLNALTDIFAAAGKSKVEAMVRARIVYYHQIGYYAIRAKEVRERRLSLIPEYNTILANLD